jgi:hypothetical protein
MARHACISLLKQKTEFFTNALHGKERTKIECGKAHFKPWQLFRELTAHYVVARSVDDVLAKAHMLQPREIKLRGILQHDHWIVPV